MSELSDWVWLVLLAVWIVTRILPRLFRSRAKQDPAPKPKSETGPWPEPAQGGPDRIDNVGPGPIEPR